MSRSQRAPILTTVVLMAAALSGCLSRPPLAVRHFVIEAPSGPIPAPAPDARLVGLEPVRVNPVYLGTSFVYKVGENRIEADPYASLAAPPRSMLTAAIRASLVRETSVREVVDGPGGPGALVVEAYVQELSGDFTHTEAPAGVLSIEFTVLAGGVPPGTPPLLRKVYTRREPLPKRTASEVAGSWNRAFPQIMKEFTADLAALPVSR